MTASQPLGTRFDRALHPASGLHRAQCRKDSQTHYIAHLLAVCAIVIENGGDEDQAIAALLHDAMEDQGGRPTLNRIRREFNDRVARIVEECSDSDAVDPEQKTEWKPRKQRYIDHLPKLSADARLVSLADKLHNVRSILEDFRRHGESLWSRFNGQTGRHALVLSGFTRSLSGFRSQRALTSVR